MRHHCSWGGILFLGGAVLAGCRTNDPPPIGTGARAVVVQYFEALVKQDWQTAYAQLHPDTQKDVDRVAFETRARVYCSQLGFPPGKVFVRSCDEQEEKAVARVILRDDKGSPGQAFHDGVILRPSPTGWGIVLADTFGRKR